VAGQPKDPAHGEGPADSGGIGRRALGVRQPGVLTLGSVLPGVGCGLLVTADMGRGLSVKTQLSQ
jgi:hypothetical protein